MSLNFFFFSILFLPNCLIEMEKRKNGPISKYPNTEIEVQNKGNIIHSVIVFLQNF